MTSLPVLFKMAAFLALLDFDMKSGFRRYLPDPKLYLNTVTKNRERLFKGAYLLNHLSLLLVLHMLKKNIPFSSRDSLQILIIFTQR